VGQDLDFGLGLPTQRLGDSVAAGGDQSVPDHLEREEVLPLLAQDPTEAFDVGLEEFPVPRRRALRVHQSLALQKSDLRDGHVGEFLSEKGKDVPNREVGAGGHQSVTGLRPRGRAA
jgi:hypothetical protein